MTFAAAGAAGEMSEPVIWLSAVVIGRILAASGSPPPDVSDPALLLIKRHNAVVGCTPDDGGVSGDAAVDSAIVTGDAGTDDAGTDATIDAAIDAGPSDAGVGDGGIGDADVPDASTCTMIPGDAVTMIVQPHVATGLDGTRFAVLLVTPARPIVELQGDVFSNLARVTAPLIDTEIVEVEDPAMGQVCSGCGSSNSDGCGGDYGDDTWWTPPGVGDAGLGDGGLVEEMLGPYQFVRAQPADSMQLAQWLDQLGYTYMQDDLDAVAPYISLGYHVVAIRVSLDKPLRAAMTPIALTWPGSELRVPASLGRGAVTTGPLTVYIAAEGRYELPGASVPFARFTGGGDAPFLTRNEIVLNQNRPIANDPIATHVADDVFQEVKVVTKYVHVPVSVMCEDRGCCQDCNARPRTRVDLVTVVFAVGYVLRRRRRRRSSQSSTRGTL